MGKSMASCSEIPFNQTNKSAQPGLHSRTLGFDVVSSEMQLPSALEELNFKSGKIWNLHLGDFFLFKVLLFFPW